MPPVAEQMPRLAALLAAYSTLAPVSYTLRSPLAATPSSHSQYLAHLWLHRQESRGWLRPVALHLQPSNDSTAPGSLSMLHNPSFAISCTASTILI
jgi:hypothetical protein